MAKRRTGLNTLAYTGVTPASTFNYFRSRRNPTTLDYKNYFIGDMWLNQPEDRVWMLVNKDHTIAHPEGVATWIEFHGYFDIGNGLDGQVYIAGGVQPQWGYITSAGGTIGFNTGANTLELEVIGGVGATYFQTDAGLATSLAGTIQILGGANYDTTGAGNIVTINIANDVVIPNTLTVSTMGAGVVQSTAAGLLFSDNGLNGEVIIGGGTEPNWNPITSGTIAITSPGPNTINLEAIGLPSSGVKFFAYQTGDVNNVIGQGNTVTGTTYTLGVGGAAAGIFTELYDDGNDFYPGDGAGTPAYFTAPADGKYFFSVMYLIDDPTLVILYAHANWGELAIVTTGRTFILKKPPVFQANYVYTNPCLDPWWFDCFCEMTMGDTATFTIRVHSEASPANLIDILATHTYIYGHGVV